MKLFTIAFGWDGSGSTAIPSPHSVPETPPAPAPKRASGHWLYGPVKPMNDLQDGYTYCSVCGRPEKAWNKERKFCSYCGARLEGWS